MGDTFQCAKCGAKYTRERRRVGRAVVCSCGHKFLVPPPDEGPPEATRPPAPTRRDYRPPQGRPGKAADDSSGEVLPLAEVVEAGPAPAGRWAEPVAPEEHLPEAEVVYPSSVEPAHPVDDMFSSVDAYAGQLNAMGGAALPRNARLPAASTVKKRRAPRKDGGQSKNVTDIIANVVLFGMLPISALFFVLGLVQYNRLGRLFPGEPPRVAPQQPAFGGGLQHAPPAAAAGLPIFIERATKKPDGDDFTMEYNVRPGSLNATSQYVWVVSTSQGRIEFPMSALAPGQGRISGRTAQPSGLMPPFTAYIEEQSAGGRTRASNDVAVAIGG